MLSLSIEMVDNFDCVKTQCTLCIAISFEAAVLHLTMTLLKKVSRE